MSIKITIIEGSQSPNYLLLRGSLYILFTWIESKREINTTVLVKNKQSQTCRHRKITTRTNKRAEKQRYQKNRSTRKQGNCRNSFIQLNLKGKGGKKKNLKEPAKAGASSSTKNLQFMEHKLTIKLCWPQKDGCRVCSDCSPHLFNYSERNKKPNLSWGRFLGDLLGLGDNFFDPSNHVEWLLGKVVILAIQNTLSIERRKNIKCIDTVTKIRTKMEVADSLLDDNSWCSAKNSAQCEGSGVSSFSIKAGVELKLMAHCCFTNYCKKISVLFRLQYPYFFTF